MLPDRILWPDRIGELLEADDNIRTLITQRAHTSMIQEAAISGGMVPVHRDGIRKVLAGRRHSRK